MYSPAAIKATINGTVKVGISIDKYGTVDHAWIIKGLGYGLDEKAVEAVRKWKFEGLGYRSTNTVDVNFSMQNVR